ncbi:ABC transporter substrate-binding protein [Microbaculum marinum]|uniref:ABC transporter substrate-binding protein n=1 Tax=Microbaculum marinum TaxID=1764581 RepID=A0AAW9RT69_9HYPH
MPDKLSIALGVYDRTLPLIAGLTPIEGVESTFVCDPLESIFHRAFDEVAFDVSELSFSNFLHLAAAGTCPYVGIPIFPSRAYRHSIVYVRTDRAIASAKDLAGRRVGVREYSMTAALVARGLLKDDFGLEAASIQWTCGRVDASDTPPVVRVRPRGIELDQLDDEDNLSDALLEGRIDAMFAYRPPPAFTVGSGVGRLFTDHIASEQDYARRTGIFPIMHLIGIRRDLAQGDLPFRIAMAFEASKAFAIKRLGDSQAPFSSLPWSAGEFHHTRALLGADYWSYGIQNNMAELESLVRYSVDQGIIEREMEIENLFCPSLLNWNT